MCLFSFFFFLPRSSSLLAFRICFFFSFKPCKTKKCPTREPPPTKNSKPSCETSRAMAPKSKNTYPPHEPLLAETNQDQVSWGDCVESSRTTRRPDESTRHSTGYGARSASFRGGGNAKTESRRYAPRQNRHMYRRAPPKRERSPRRHPEPRRRSRSRSRHRSTSPVSFLTPGPNSQVTRPHEPDRFSLPSVSPREEAKAPFRRASPPPREKSTTSASTQMVSSDTVQRMTEILSHGGGLVAAMTAAAGPLGEEITQRNRQLVREQNAAEREILRKCQQINELQRQQTRELRHTQRQYEYKRQMANAEAQGQTMILAAIARQLQPMVAPSST